MSGKMDLPPANDDGRKGWPASESPHRVPAGGPQFESPGDAAQSHAGPGDDGRTDRSRGAVMKSSKGRPTKRTSPQRMAAPGYMADTINSATKKSPRVARSSSVSHVPPEKSKAAKAVMKQQDPNMHAVSAAELRARLESLQQQKVSTRLKVAEVLDVGSSSESSPHPRHAWNFGDGVSQLSGIARFYGDQVPFLASGVVTFTAPLSPFGTQSSPLGVATATATTVHAAALPPAAAPNHSVAPQPARSSGPASPVIHTSAAASSQAPPAQSPLAAAAPPAMAGLTPAAAIMTEADKYPVVDKPAGPEAYILELEDKVKSLQNAINVLHLERSTAQEKANILEAHCKRITLKWESDRNRMLDLESKLNCGKPESSDDAGDYRKSSTFAKGAEPSWDAMRVAELEHMKAENSRLRDENAMLKRRIVSLNADIETQAHLVKQRTKSVVPELKVLRRRIADLEAENEELMALAKKAKPFEDLDVAALLKEHTELRSATNDLLIQHDKVCSDYLALRDALAVSTMTPEDTEYSPDNSRPHTAVPAPEEVAGEAE
eukprot:EG_transcript_5408